MSSNADNTTIIVAGARTPFGRLWVAEGLQRRDLGAIAVKGALEKSGVPASAVDYVIMGQVLTAGAGQMPPAETAIKAGIPWDVPTLTINKMCLSGIDAIALADQLIRAGEFECVVAGGQESMTQAPHLLPKSRTGFKYGNTELVDHTAFDGLHDAFTDQPMGALTEQGNDTDGFTREQQDEVAARSHQLAAAAWKNGLFDDEVVPVEIPQRKGDPIVFNEDEGIRANTTVESLAGLRPAFRKDGTITAGNSSQICDSAAAVIVMSKAKAEELGVSWIAEIGAHGVVAGPDSSLQAQPANAIAKACAREGIDPADNRSHRDQRGLRGGRPGIDQAARRRPGEGERQRRRHRHRPPDGTSGARITLLHLALELAHGGGMGAAALCGAGGGHALGVRVPKA